MDNNKGKCADESNIDESNICIKNSTLFNRVFGRKYSVELLDMKVWKEKDGRVLGEVSFSFGELMTALDIRIVCSNVAKWIGGDLYGTVNLDFSGTVPSLDMMVELR